MGVVGSGRWAHTTRPAMGWCVRTCACVPVHACVRCGLAHPATHRPPPLGVRSGTAAAGSWLPHLVQAHDVGKVHDVKGVVQLVCLHQLGGLGLHAVGAACSTCTTQHHTGQRRSTASRVCLLLLLACVLRSTPLRQAAAGHASHALHAPDQMQGTPALQAGGSLMWRFPHRVQCAAPAGPSAQLLLPAFQLQAGASGCAALPWWHGPGPPQPPAQTHCCHRRMSSCGPGSATGCSG